MAAHSRSLAHVLLLLVLTLLVLAPQAGSAHVAQAASLSFVVTSTVDAPDAHPGDGACADSAGQCTLRAATQEANAQPGGSSIVVTVPGGAYRLPVGPLALMGNTTVISGSGAGATLLVGQDSQVLTVASAATVVLVGLTIAGGNAGTGNGGGIANAGTVALSKSAVVSSTAIDQGGIQASGCPLTDQRGVVRPDTGETRCDVGAFESQGVG